MGLDARIIFQAKDLTTTLDEFEALFEEHHPGFLWIDPKYEVRGLNPTHYDDEMLAVSTLWRYYGIGYERGPLWDILKAIYLVKSTVDGDVWYGDDHIEPQPDDNYEPFTDQDAQELIHHWARDPLGEYRRSRRRHPHG